MVLAFRLGIPGLNPAQTFFFFFMHLFICFFVADFVHRKASALLHDHKHCKNLLCGVVKESIPGYLPSKVEEHGFCFVCLFVFPLVHLFVNLSTGLSGSFYPLDTIVTKLYTYAYVYDSLHIQVFYAPASIDQWHIVFGLFVLSVGPSVHFLSAKTLTLAFSFDC